MESLRGFPEFMRAAAVAQERFPNLHVIVFGNDRAAYSYSSPHPSGSWKQHMLEELEGYLDLNRLHFTGLINYGELVQLFRRSDLHCYFTRPYVVSWGIFQAVACGARLLVNDFPGLCELYEGKPAIPPVDLDNQENINASVVRYLNPSVETDAIRLLPSLSFASCMKQWIHLIRSLSVS